MERKPRTIFHVDMDSFYASVEIQRNPSLEGQSVIVGPDPKKGTGRGVVLTCSYEARKYGVRSGMPISIAYRLCPNGTYLPANMGLYAAVSDRVMTILRGFADRFEQTGIDEAFLDVTKRLQEYGKPENLALAVKKAVYEKEGLTCSIGVAPNKSVAKIASDFRKPNGLTVVDPDRVKDFLAPLEVSRIVGVGKKTQKVLEEIGIETIRQLAEYPKERLLQTLGSYGLELWNVANGTDNSEVVAGDREAKSVSSEHTFEIDTAEQSILVKTLDSMASRLHNELKESKLLFKTVTLKIRFQDFQTFTRSRSLSYHTLNEKAISDTARRLLKEFENDKRKVRLVGVKVSGLVGSNASLELIDRYF